MYFTRYVGLTPRTLRFCYNPPKICLLKSGKLRVHKLQMAVLKSPRNSRNKGNWASSYKLSNLPSYKTISEKPNAKVLHKLSRFLRDSSHWTVTTPHQNSQVTRTGLGIDKNRPPVWITYGLNRFDSTSTHPTVLKKYSRTGSLRERYCILLNLEPFVQGQN